MWNLQQQEKDIDIQTAIIVLEHKQPATPFKTDNYMTEGFVNSGMKPKHSKTWDMKWHWLRDMEVLKQLIVYWNRGSPCQRQEAVM